MIKEFCDGCGKEISIKRTRYIREKNNKAYIIVVLYKDCDLILDAAEIAAFNKIRGGKESD